MQKTPVKLGPTQTTLLIPLLGRAVETQKKGGLLSDPKAVEIVESLDYDFDKWKNIPSLVGASLRARIVDDEVRAFLREYPEGTVVEIGAGLNTRYERLDNGRARWLEFDLPDSMALRRQFFEDTPRRVMLAASALEQDWYGEVKALPGPYCFVSEAVLIYLEKEQVEEAVRGLVNHFPGSWFITDTTSTKMVDSQGKHDAMSTLPQESWFRWRCDDPKTIEAWGIKLQKSLSFADAPAEIRADMPFKWRALMTVAPWLIRRMTGGYSINRYLLG